MELAMVDTCEKSQEAHASLQTLRKEMKEAFIERDKHVDGALVALLARHHILLLGPPGTAKSMLARKISSVFGMSYFEQLLSAYTTPEEVFGLFSIPKIYM